MGWMLAALFIGTCIGSLTGLIPGFHVNNVALILLGVSPALLAIGIPLSAAAGIIVATGVVHTFLGYIPSALIGAPSGLIAGRVVSITESSNDLIAARRKGIRMVTKFMIGTRSRGSSFIVLRFNNVYLYTTKSENCSVYLDNTLSLEPD